MGPAVKTILLVEDDTNDARLLQRAFDRAGLDRQVLRLTNGDEAVAYMMGEGDYANRRAYPPPNLLILDIKLPRRNGFEVLSWMRGMASEYRRVPVVVLSSSREPVDVNRAYELGANSYLRKPDGTEGWMKVAEAIQQYWLRLNHDPEQDSSL